MNPMIAPTSIATGTARQAKSDMPFTSFATSRLAMTAARATTPSTESGMCP